LVSYNLMEKSFLEFLEEEEELYNHHLSVLEKVKYEHVFSLEDMEPYKSMISKLSTQNIKTAPYRTAFIITQVARMIYSFLNDLALLLKNYNFKLKDKVLKEIDTLKEKVKETVDAFYDYYGFTPYPRYYERYYEKDRVNYGLPYYNYEEYYMNLYPTKQKQMSLEDEIFQMITTSDDNYDSKQFVPASFMGTNGEYKQYIALKAYKELKKLQPKITALEDESRLPLSERMLNRIRRGEWR